jgi:hypothetical protein
MANATQSDIKALTDAIKALSSKVSGGGGGGGGSVDPSAAAAAAASLADMSKSLDEAKTTMEKIEVLKKSIAKSAGHQNTLDNVARAMQNEQLKLAREKDKYTLNAVHTVDVMLGQNARRLDMARSDEAISRSNLILAQEMQQKVEAKADATAEELATAEEVLINAVAQAQEYKKMVESLEKQERALKKGATAQAAQLSETKNMLGMMGLSADSWEESMWGRMEAMQEAGVSPFAAMAEEITKSLAPQNLFASLTGQIYEQTQKMVGAMDTALATFNKTTGAAGEMDTVMYEVHSNMGPIAGTLDDAATAVTALYTEMATFSNMSKESQASMATLVATLERLGVSAQTSSKLLETMTMSLGMSGAQAESTLTDMTMFADQLNIPISQVMENLNSSMSVLAKYGKQGVEVFKKVEAAAKATGIATQDLIAITEQFDTFQSAAESVGRLNGILGGNYLNSLEMVNMTEDERIRKLMGVVDVSGKSWEAMSRHEKQAVAAAAGIRDMNKANKLFGAGLAGYDAMLAKQGANADAQARQEEMAKKAATALEKMDSLLQQLAIAVEPILWLFHAIADVMIKINDITGGAFIPVLFALIGIYWAFTAAIWANIAARWAEFKVNVWMIATQIKEGAVRAYNTVLTWAQVVATNALAMSTMKALGAIGLFIGVYMLLKEFMGPVAALLFTVAAGMIFLGFATATATKKWMLFATAIAAIISLFVEPHSPPFYLLLPIIALGIFLIGRALDATIGSFAAAGPALVAFGVGLIVVGVGLIIIAAAVFLIAAGIALVVAALALLVFAFVELVKAISVAGADILLFALSLPLIAVFAIPAMIGLLLLSIALFALGIALLLIDPEDLEYLGGFFGAVGKAFSGDAAKNILSFAFGLAAIAIAAPFAAFGLLLMAFGLLALGLSLLFIKTEDLQALATMFEGLGKLGEGGAGAMTGMVSFLDTLAKIADDADPFALFAISEIFDSMARMGTIETGPLEAMGTFFDGLSGVAVDQVTVLAAALYDLADALNDMPLFAPIMVAAMFESLGELDAGPAETLTQLNKVIVSASQIDDGKATNVEKVTKSITDMVLELQGGLFTNADATKEILESLAKVFAGGEKSSAKGGENKIILALDREGHKRLAEVIVPHMEDLINKKYSIAKVRS